MSDELTELARAVKLHRRDVELANLALEEAIMQTYRAQRSDGTPAFTLAEIGEVLGVSKQRAYQRVREVARRAEAGRTPARAH